MHLVLIETSGNQKYIFATNKLRENVGASENTYRVGTQLVLRAVAEAGGPRLLTSSDPAIIRRNLADQTRNPAIESEGAEVEVVIATSGKAILLVRKLEVARDIVRRVSAQALRTAPGVEVCGVVSQGFDWRHRPLWEVNRDLHHEQELVRANLPGSRLRFLRLPFVAECARSGLPAAAWETQGPEAEQGPRSAVSREKGRLAEDARDRMAQLLQGQPGLRFARDLNELDQDLEESKWVAVIHADGNGVGRIFLHFEQFVNASGSRDYVDQLRTFSRALEICTERAFKDALSVVPTLPSRRGRRVLLVPLVLGGDDLTVLCDGQAALEFTERYLRAFERETGRRDDPATEIVPRVAMAAYGMPRLSSCAGVAIVKPHFPFFAAYRLSEQLITSAKEVKKRVRSATGGAVPCSALDFHILYDSVGSDLTEIRKRLTIEVGGTTRCYARPYVVTPLAALEGQEGRDWCEPRHWEDVLISQVRALRRKQPDPDRSPVLPRTQVHELRTGLSRGHQEADARLNLIYGRYRESLKDLTVMRGERPSLFREEIDDEGRRVRFTSFLDAADAAEFLGPEEKP